MTTATAEHLAQLQFAHARRQRIVFAALSVLLAATLVVSLSVGASGIPVSHVLDALLSKVGLGGGLSSAGEQAILWRIRMPRAIFAVVSGAGLAMAGVLVQAVFRNPLAAPDVIGTTGGAACGAALALTLLPSTAPMIFQIFGVPAAAFVGGVLATFLVLKASEVGGRPSAVMMLLIGIAINAFTGALVGLLTAISTDTNLRSITSWLLGSIAGSNWVHVGLVSITTAVGGWLLLRKTRALDALSIGETEAWASGIDVNYEKRSAVALAALLSATVVAFAGMIGFIALVIPHLMRLVLGASHKGLIPASALAGATLFLTSDTLARVLIAPRELPVGVITAFLGAPVFMFLLYHGARRRASWLS